MNLPQRKSGRSVLAAVALLILAQCYGLVALAGPDKPQPELPELSVSVLQFGTAHWELDHIAHKQLDRKHGYRLALRVVANLSASHIAVTSGSAHGAVADLLWAQSRYQAGSPYLYIPFSSRIGDIVVPENSGVHSLADLLVALNLAPSLLYWGMCFLKHGQANTQNSLTVLLFRWLKQKQSFQLGRLPGSGYGHFYGILRTQCSRLCEMVSLPELRNR